jgi:hypothetical protein
MIAVSVVEKFEADRQLAFDEYCQTSFVASLPETDGPGTGAGRDPTDAAVELKTSVDRLMDTLDQGLQFSIRRDRQQG